MNKVLKYLTFTTIFSIMSVNCFALTYRPFPLINPKGEVDKKALEWTIQDLYFNKADRIRAIDGVNISTIPISQIPDFTIVAGSVTKQWTEIYNTRYSTGNFIKQDGYNGNNNSATISSITANNIRVNSNVNVVGETTSGTLYSSGTLQVNGRTDIGGELFINSGNGKINVATINSGSGEVSFLNNKMTNVSKINLYTDSSPTDRTGFSFSAHDIAINDSNLNFQDINHIVNCPEIDAVMTSTNQLIGLYNNSASTDTVQWTSIYDIHKATVNVSLDISSTPVLFTQSYNTSFSTGNFLKQDGYNRDNASVSVGSATIKNNLMVTNTIYIDNITERTSGTGVFIDRFVSHYAGVWQSQPNITDNGDGTITLSTCQVIIYDQPDYHHGSWLKSVSAATLTPTNKEVSFVCINWNAGTPAYELVTLANRYTINQSTIVPVYRVFQDGNTLDYYVSYGTLANGLPNKEADRLIRLRGIERESGLGISAVEGRHFKVDSGFMWFGLTRFTQDISMSSAPLITEVNHWSYQPGGWMVSTSTGMWHNTMYQTATTTAEVTTNKAVTTWIYRNLYKNEVDCLYGLEQGDNLTEALTRSEPSSRPPHLDQFYKLVGRIIAIKGTSTASSIQSIADTTFASGFNGDHTQLTNIGTNTHTVIDTKLSDLITSSATQNTRLNNIETSSPTWYYKTGGLISGKVWATSEGSFNSLFSSKTLIVNSGLESSVVGSTGSDRTLLVAGELGVGGRLASTSKYHFSIQANGDLSITESEVASRMKVGSSGVTIPLALTVGSATVNGNQTTTGNSVINGSLNGATANFSGATTFVSSMTARNAFEVASTNNSVKIQNSTITGGYAGQSNLALKSIESVEVVVDTDYDDAGSALYVKRGTGENLFIVGGSSVITNNCSIKMPGRSINSGVVTMSSTSVNGNANITGSLNVTGQTTGGNINATGEASCSTFYATGTMQTSGNFTIKKNQPIIFMQGGEADDNTNNTYYRGARGSAASPSLITNGDSCSNWNFQGWDGDQWRFMGLMKVVVDGTAADDDMPGKFEFYTVADGGTSLGLAMYINNAKNAWFAADVSALTFTDRTSYTNDKQLVWDSINSMKPLANGDIDCESLNPYIRKELKEDKYNPITKSTESVKVYGRNLTESVSVHNEAIKDLLSQIESLKLEVKALKEK